MLGAVHPLTAAIPDTEVRRSEIVAARLARKVAPLFGVIWQQNPFGCTWICDFAALTLAEIARGAPYPPRETQSALDAAAGRSQPGAPGGDPAEPPPWSLTGRAVWTPRRGPTPAAIAHATLNRYGPDTKAAVVLTGANRLLQDVTKAAADVCRYLTDRRVSPELRLAVWAGLVLEAYRGQPALVVAAIQARAIQRALTAPWARQVSLAGHGNWARCEIGEVAASAPAASGPAADPHRPIGFDLIDTTLPLLDLPLPVDDGPLISELDLLDDVANRWCRRLLQVGRPGRGIAWVAEQDGLHRTLQTYVRVGSLIAPFVAEVFTALAIGRGHGRHLAQEQLSILPAGPELQGMPVVSRRAHLLSAHTVANYVRFHDDILREQPYLRTATREAVLTAAEAAAACLGPADPARLLLDGYAAYCQVWDSCRDPEPGHGQLPRAAAELAAQQQRLAAAWQAGSLDPGTASYLLEIGAMALGRASAVLGEPVAPGAVLAARWREVMLARGLDPDRDFAEPARLAESQQYHLQNYAEFLASQATDAAALRRALVIQRACVHVRDQVARGELAEYESKFTSTRTSHQVAAAITARLLDALEPGAGHERDDVLAEGLRHVREVLANPTARAMLAEPGTDPELVRMALALLPLLVRAAQETHPGMNAALLADAGLLLQAASAGAAQLGRALPDADRATLAALGERLRAHAAAG